MKITFVSNYLNHHQLPFCLAMVKLLGDDFKFVATSEMSNERLELGYEDFNSKYSFVVESNVSESVTPELYSLVDNSDVVIYGSTTCDELFHRRICQDKLTLRYSERVYKKGVWRSISPRGQYYMRKNNTKYRNNNLYLLSASAYAPYDFSLVGAYKNKAFKWGYFPKTYTYDIESLLEAKNNNKIQILWVARFISLKHPDLTIKLAKLLKNNGYNFEMKLIGVGPLENKVRKLIKKNNLMDYVSILGSMSPEEVRSYMEKANIFISTSDYNEGWGAVINEAMNSGCAVVASHAIGAAPYLIKHGENGLVYKNNSNADFYTQVKKLMDDTSYVEFLGKNAYQTITTTWNAEQASKNLIRLCEALLNKENFHVEYGPCSKAPIISQNKMYESIVNKN